ncbi:alpha/beta fold hydrolase BchO [Aurantiacibacter zhengii]|uniref:Alpha/beta fold hydrolase n=1 Tax=Aurantiacibacter zhengii TaxID=2307003 RepID=A0A418NQZ6_9SPHN|nr:alpha/beta fold hydrolase BchO [Aurantiacibacter zhengii]RIV85589.1 alpha/beta fold hydrolase [Aurantiacibacter zhengii]
MSGPPDWQREGRIFPHQDASRFVKAGSLEWHVQVMGSGPALLLLHGTGASAHSWRDVMPLLAEDFTVIAPDLPGHGFTRGRIAGGPNLKAVAREVARLLDIMAVKPDMLVGHSAGVAIAIELALGGSAVPVAGFSPALMPFPGLAAQLFPAMAKVLFVNPFVPRIFARMARQSGETARFLRRATGSDIDASGLRCYEALLGNSRHCEGALALMANWDLDALSRRLPDLTVPVSLVHGSRDRAVPLSSARQACSKLPHCELTVLDGLGHLAHEERPEDAARHIRHFAARHAIIASGSVDEEDERHG